MTTKRIVRVCTNEQLQSALIDDPLAVNIEIVDADTLVADAFAHAKAEAVRDAQHVLALAERQRCQQLFELTLDWPRPELHQAIVDGISPDEYACLMTKLAEADRKPLPAPYFSSHIH